MKLAGLTACNNPPEEMKTKEECTSEERDGERQLRKGCKNSGPEQSQVLLLTHGWQSWAPRNRQLIWDSGEGYSKESSPHCFSIFLNQKQGTVVWPCFCFPLVSSKTKANHNELSSERKPAHKEVSFFAISTQTLGNKAVNALATMISSQLLKQHSTLPYA